METYFIPIQDTNFQLLNIKMGDGERREKMLKMWKNCRFSYLSTGERFSVLQLPKQLFWFWRAEVIFGNWTFCLLQPRVGVRAKRFSNVDLCCSIGAFISTVYFPREISRLIESLCTLEMLALLDNYNLDLALSSSGAKMKNPIKFTSSSSVLSTRSLARICLISLESHRSALLPFFSGFLLRLFIAPSCFACLFFFLLRLDFSNCRPDAVIHDV